jgi:beta-glucosidase
MEGRTYRYFEGEPLFPFGYGLSYTEFLFGNLKISPASIQAGDQVTVSCDVTNTGDRAGDEVVQLYIRHPRATVPCPIKELKGFARITLEPGETKTVTFILHTDLLAIYDENVSHVVQPGLVDVMVGNSSDSLPLSGQLEIVGPPAEVGLSKTFFSTTQIR